MPKTPTPKWTCRWCGKSNAPKVYTCECGKPKPKASA